MRRTSAVGLALLALALGLLGAGCLDGTETTATADTVVGTLPTTTTDTSDLPALALKGDPTAGKAVFTSAGCVGCHTLADAGATGTVGPNLAGIASRTKIAGGAVTNSGPADLKKWIMDPAADKPGTAMPKVPLTDDELNDIVAFLETLK